MPLSLVSPSDFAVFPSLDALIASAAPNVRSTVYGVAGCDLMRGSDGISGELGAFETSAELDSFLAGANTSAFAHTTTTVIVGGVLWGWDALAGVPHFRPFDVAAPGSFLVRFLDYRGGVVSEQYVAAGGSVAPPSAPSFAGLTFAQWSGIASNVQSDIDIIAVYVAADGKRTLLIESSEISGNLPTFKGVKSDTSTLTIDWGDGTTSTSSASGNVTIAKTEAYAVDGEYRIKYWISSGTGTVSGGHGTAGNPLLAGVAVTEFWGTADATNVAAYTFNGTAFRTMRYATGFVAATSIGANAFQSCRNLVSVTIGQNCTLIDTLALDGLRNLRTLTIQATTPPTLASVATLADFDPRLLIYVPSASVATYKAETNWSAFASRIVGY